nr:phytanoyl-CoA dioxygenase family protein [uncultured Rhodoferax sp.]
MTDKDVTLFRQDDSADSMLRTFAQRGWVGPFPLLGRDECDRLIARARTVAHQCVAPDAMDARDRRSNFGERKWFKGLHEVHPIFRDLAAHPEIVRIVTILIGPDVLAWGVSAKRVRSGRGHRWHVDAEQTICDGVTVFLGLRNVDRHSTLKVLSGSHRLRASPQDLKLASNEQILAHGRRHLSDCSLETVSPGDGGFFVMHGRLWHGSNNTSPKDRDAMILQYCIPERQVRIPLTFDEPIVWSEERPGCMLVAGDDHFHVNRLIAYGAKE